MITSTQHHTNYANLFDAKFKKHAFGSKKNAKSRRDASNASSNMQLNHGERTKMEAMTRWRKTTVVLLMAPGRAEFFVAVKSGGRITKKDYLRESNGDLRLALFPTNNFI